MTSWDVRFKTELSEINQLIIDSLGNVSFSEVNIDLYLRALEWIWLGSLLFERTLVGSVDSTQFQRSNIRSHNPEGFSEMIIKTARCSCLD